VSGTCLTQTTMFMDGTDLLRCWPTACHGLNVTRW
jgi:hypothetical protein